MRIHSPTNLSVMPPAKSVPRRRIAPKREGKRAVPLSGSPRPVPLGAVVVSLFGGFLPITGYIIMACSSVAVWTYPMHSELLTPLYFSGRLATTTGTVLESEHLRSRRGRALFTRVPNMLEVPVLRVRFSYIVDGVAYEEFSFTPMGREISMTQVVEYRIDAPQTARIQGMRYFYYSWSTIWVIIFLLIGLLLVLPRLCQAADQVELLRNGAITHGTLVEKRGGNDDGLCACVFEYHVAGAVVDGGEGGDSSVKLPGCGSHAGGGNRGRGGSMPFAKHASSSGYQPIAYRVEHIDMETASVEDELWEPILYLPNNPAVAAVLDGLIVRPTREGHWEPPSSWCWYLLAPLSFVMANLWCASNYR